MKLLPNALLWSFLTLTIQAAPVALGTLKLQDGRELQNVTVTKVEPDGLRLEHRDGVGKVRMEDLPPEVSQRFNLDESTATAWRQEEKKRLDEEAANRRRAQTRVLMEASRADQDAQVRTKRMAIFDQAKASSANYAALDDQLLTQIQLWKDAGRDDLAARFEEDRQVLKQQEIARPAAVLESEKQALARRVEALQSEVNAANLRPTTTTVVIDSDRRSRNGYDPYYSSFYSQPSYYVPSPVIVNPPYCPPTSNPPISRPTPLAPQRQPVMNMGNPIFGSHLYGK